MTHYAAFHLGLHCLPKYLFTGNQNEKGSKIKLFELVIEKICTDQTAQISSLANTFIECR